MAGEHMAAELTRGDQRIALLSVRQSWPSCLVAYLYLYQQSFIFHPLANVPQARGPNIAISLRGGDHIAYVALHALASPHMQHDMPAAAAALAMRP